MCEDRRRYHPEADPEEALGRRGVARLDLAVRIFEGPREPSTAVLRWAADPAEAGIKLAGAPRPTGRELLTLLVRGLVGKEADAITPLAPFRDLLVGDSNVGIE